jgi:hypothetical protein
MPVPTEQTLTQPIAAPFQERRRSPRRPCVEEAPLWPLGAEGEPPRWASVQNVSPHGVGLLLSCHFPPGAAVAIGLPPACGRDGRAVAGRVVHATPAPLGNWWLGCSLDGDGAPQ